MGGRLSLATPERIGRKRGILWFLREYASAYLMLAPNFILFCVFVIYPILWTLRFMFFETDGMSKSVLVGLDNFVRAFTRDPVWWQSVGNTMAFTVGKLVLEIPLAIVLAVVLNSGLRGKNLLRGIYFLPTITSAAIMSLIFSFMFSPYNGMVNVWLVKIGAISSNISWLEGKVSAMVCCILVSVWQNFGTNMLLVISGLQNIPHDMYESAYIDGATKSQCFWRITLPMLSPVLQIIIMLSIIGTLQTFDTIFVLTGGGPHHATEVMAINIYTHFFAGAQAPSYGYGATLGFLSSLVIGVFTVIYLTVTARMKRVYE